MLRPFVQDTMQWGPLTLTMAAMMLKDPLVVVRVVAQVRPSCSPLASQLHGGWTQIQTSAQDPGELRTCPDAMSRWRAVHVVGRACCIAAHVWRWCQRCCLCYRGDEDLCSRPVLLHGCAGQKHRDSPYWLRTESGMMTAVPAHESTLIPADTGLLWGRWGLLCCWTGSGTTLLSQHMLF